MTKKYEHEYVAKEAVSECRKVVAKAIADAGDRIQYTEERVQAAGWDDMLFIDAHTGIENLGIFLANLVLWDEVINGEEASHAD